MNWDVNTIFRFLVYIAIGGLILLAITYFTPLIFLLGIAALIYLIYRFLKTGRIGL